MRLIRTSSSRRSSACSSLVASSVASGDLATSFEKLDAMPATVTLSVSAKVVIIIYSDLFVTQCLHMHVIYIHVIYLIFNLGIYPVYLGQGGYKNKNLLIKLK